MLRISRACRQCFIRKAFSALYTDIQHIACQLPPVSYAGLTYVGRAVSLYMHRERGIAATVSVAGVGCGIRRIRWSWPALIASGGRIRRHSIKENRGHRRIYVLTSAKNASDRDNYHKPDHCERLFESPHECAVGATRRSECRNVSNAVSRAHR
jgi:hypothetical protein